MALNSKSKKHKMLGKKNLKTQYIYIYIYITLRIKKNDKLMTYVTREKYYFFEKMQKPIILIQK